MSFLLLLPHQLFEPKYFSFKPNLVILYEHPQYFEKYKFNKKKLVLHRASMKMFEKHLNKKGYKVEYLEYNVKENEIQLEKCKMFDPVDNLGITKKVEEVMETPNFLLTNKDYENYRKLKKDKFFFKSFYNYGKKINDIIPDVDSKDKDNRQRMPKDIKIPDLVKHTKDEEKYIKEAIQYVENNFPKNYGNTENFWCPISHKGAMKWFKDFLKNKFEKFGPYEDFMRKGEDFLFHSGLSCAINIGLLNPKEIFEIIKPLKNKFPINSFEGYVRQLYWREYQRYCFKYCPFDTNYFGNTNKLTKKWYTGELGIPPVDDAINVAFDRGYLHHIYRLMVVGNFMSLSEIDPKEGFKWFMEFSVDSYEWVMYQNVLDMVFFVTGGKTMRKPYITSSNYILRMSDYKKGEWSEKWNEMYQNFMKNHKEELYKYRYSFPGLKKL